MSDTEDGRKPWHWKPGQSGNPKGRPRGARNKLSEAFIADLLESWMAQGKKAIADVIDKKPDVYLRVVASLVPKQVKLKTGDFDDLGDTELAALIVAARTALHAAESGGSGSDDKGGAKPPGDLPPVH